MFIKLSSAYFWYFAMIGLFMPYTSVLLDSYGFDSIAIGQILAIATATKIIGPSLFAHFADGSGKQKVFIQLGALLSLAGFLLLLINENYTVVVLSLALFSLFNAAYQPQLEVLTQACVKGSAKIYGRIRLWGSIGFVIAAFIAGVLIEQHPKYTYIGFGLILLIAMIYSSILLPQPKIKRVSQYYKIRYKLFNKSFISFFLAGTLLQISFGAYYSFFALYLRQLEFESYSTGAFLAVSIVAEVIMFIFAGKIFNKFTVKAALVASLLLTSVRWLLMATANSNGIHIFIGQILHAASFGLNHAASMLFLKRHFNQLQQSRAQAIYVGGIYGAGSALGVWLAGITWQQGSGAFLTYVWSAATTLLAAFIVVLLLPNKAIQAKN